MDHGTSSPRKSLPFPRRFSEVNFCSMPSSVGKAPDSEACEPDVEKSISIRFDKSAISEGSIPATLFKLRCNLMNEPFASHGAVLDPEYQVHSLLSDSHRSLLLHRPPSVLKYIVARANLWIS